jgi:hypothetical protein
MLLIIISLSLALLASTSALITKKNKAITLLNSLFLASSGVSATLVSVLTILNKNAIFFTLPFGINNWSWHFHFDALSSFFFAILGIITFVISIYAPSYLRQYQKNSSLKLVTFFTGLFIFSMYLVLIANDIFTFMFSWELMSISSYFLVIENHQHTANRKAAFIYLLMAHLSGLLILSGFSVLAKFSNNYIFTYFANANIPAAFASIAFVFALLGFGTKAGIVPFHVWLPKAHPVAPSHISALMSGVMLKIAIYGFIRFCFVFLPAMQWEWGVIVIIIGTISALIGILSAITQNDLKKLLAYSSIENVGIIFIGLGLSIIFLATNHPILATLGLIAALYHALNHAIFKSLLFLNAGAIIQRAHEHDLEKMGGLIHKMPQTALLFLVGCISISALPPFNGFISEWLTFQTALQAPILQSGLLRILIPVAAALLALTGTLTAACFVKVFGTVFLGKSRTHHILHSHETSVSMRFAMLILSILCLLFGIFPNFVINILNRITLELLHNTLSNTDVNQFLWLTPKTNNIASLSTILIMIGIITGLCLTYILIKIILNKKLQNKSSPPWDCGFGMLTTKMQYSATAFAMPIRKVFAPVWKIEENVITKNNEIKYSLQIYDKIWCYIYKPLETLLNKISRLTARIQGGNIRIYLLYILATLLILLWVIA